MGIFDFKHQLSESYDGVALVAKWLRSLSSIEQVEIVQDDPDYFYTGDISFRRNNLEVKYVEVKKESRAITQTLNLAIERYSNTHRKVDGGPWRTTADYYVHVYSDDKVMAFMNTLELRRWLEADMSLFRSFTAHNVGYVTSGILVPRSIAKNTLKNYKELDLSDI